MPNGNVHLPDLDSGSDSAPDPHHWVERLARDGRDPSEVTVALLAPGLRR
ncbi:hypothetical protein [Streptomyces sp. NPDC059928]